MLDIDRKYRLSIFTIDICHQISNRMLQRMNTTILWCYPHKPTFQF